MINPFQPELARIVDIKKETYDTTTYTFAFAKPTVQAEFGFLPGQFNMITLFGIGEAPISISSDPDERDTFQHTIRHVGNLTNALNRLQIGDTVGIRGAYGTGWPMDLLTGKNVLIIAGGIGLAPLRPVITQIFQRREDFDRVEVLYGARSPGDMLFTDQYEIWAQRLGVKLTVDVVPRGEQWLHQVGVVTKLLAVMDSVPENTVALTCGPEIMMKFVVRDLLSMGFEPEQIYVSLERRMSCGVKKCGKCQIGPKFTCRDGPVFAYAELLTLPELELGGVGR